MQEPGSGVTVLVTVVTSRAAPTVNSVGVVTLDLGCLIDQPSGTEEVMAHLTSALPVLGTVKLVRVPAIRLPLAYGGRMMIVRATISVAMVVRVTILVTGAAHWSVPTGHILIKVTPVLCRIVLLVIWTGVVDPPPPHTLPVLPAVPFVCIPTVR